MVQHLAFRAKVGYALREVESLSLKPMSLKEGSDVRTKTPATKICEKVEQES